VNPEIFQKLDRTIHEKGRLGIMSLLAANSELSFTEIRDILQMTDGNVSVQIHTLEQAGYIEVDKRFRGSRTSTICKQTVAGRIAFDGYLDALEQIIKQTRSR